jgi:hypothetical protein
VRKDYTVQNAEFLLGIAIAAGLEKECEGPHMTKVFVTLALGIAGMAACSNGQAVEVSKGTDAAVETPVEKKDGGTVAHAKLADPPAASAKADAPKDEYREVAIPAGTLLLVELQTAVASDTSQVEDPVRGTLRRAVTVDGVQVLPAGTSLTGHVTSAERSGRVKGRARIAFRFTRLNPPGDGERLPIQTGVIAREAQATKKQDAAKIGGGAAGGAIIGGILGGGDGAAKGAAIGGAAGTGVVLSTRGKEVRLGPGADLSVRLQAPVAVRVRVRK